MVFNCEKLEIYKLAQDLVVLAYGMSKLFPESEKFGLVSQLRRASVSVLLNIAEGSGKWSKKDFAKFIRISIGSIIEVDTILKLAIKLKFITEKDCVAINNIIEKEYFKLVAFCKSLNK